MAKKAKSKPKKSAAAKKPVRKSASLKAKAAPRKAAKLPLRAKKPAKGAKTAKPAPGAKAKLAAKGKAAKGAKAAPVAAARTGGPAPRKPSRQRVRICKQEGCSTPQTTGGFCRLHYLQNWKALREEKAKRAQKNLDRYVERMAGAKKPSTEEGEEAAEGTAKGDEAVFEEDFGEFVDVLSREENLDKILNGIKVEDY